jgi:hypothetical protein
MLLYLDGHSPFGELREKLEVTVEFRFRVHLRTHCLRWKLTSETLRLVNIAGQFLYSALQSGVFQLPLNCSFATITLPVR